MTDSRGFGLAQVKQEGMSFSVDNPSIEPWDGMIPARDLYLKEKYPKWYQKPFRIAAGKAWNQALFKKAEKEQV